MRHNYLKDDTSGDHWAAGLGKDGVLVQLQEAGEQVRASLTPDQAEAMAQRLLQLAAEARTRAASTLPSS